MAAGDIFQQTLVQIQNNVALANVYFMKVLDDTGTTDAEDDAFSALKDEVVPFIRSLQATNLTYECCLSRRVAPTTAPSRVFAMSEIGSRTGDSLPTNVGYCVRKYSGTGLPRQRGRWYLPGPVEQDVSDGRFDDGLVTLMDGLEQIMEGTINFEGKTYRLQHYSRKFNTFWDLAKVRFQPVPCKYRPRTPGICSIS